MTPTRTIQEINRELARQINEEAKRNPQSPYAGKFVGIANGRVVVVTEDQQELVRLLLQAEPNPQKICTVEASRDYDEVDEIWSLR